MAEGKDNGVSLAIQQLGRCAAVYEETEGAKPPESWGLGFVIGFLTAYNLKPDTAVQGNEEREG